MWLGQEEECKKKKKGAETKVWKHLPPGGGKVILKEAINWLSLTLQSSAEDNMTDFDQ